MVEPVKMWFSQPFVAMLAQELQTAAQIKGPHFACKTIGQNCFLIDHEKAFSFTEMILPPEPPLKLAEHDRDWVQSHLFYTQFCTYAKDMQIDNLFDRLKAIQPHFWEAARTHFPDEWQALSLLQKNLFDTIETLMAQTIDQLEDFKISVKRLTGLKEES